MCLFVASGHLPLAGLIFKNSSPFTGSPSLIGSPLSDGSVTRCIPVFPSPFLDRRTSQSFPISSLHNPIWVRP